MNIRSAVSKDVRGIVKIERGSNAAHWNEDEYRMAIETGEPGRKILVAEDEGEVAAFAVIRFVLPECELENLAVKEELRRRGIASKLLRSVIKTAQKDGATAMHLEVRGSNVAAKALYEGAGFREIDRRSGYYQSPVEDAIRYFLEFQNEIYKSGT